MRKAKQVGDPGSGDSDLQNFLIGEFFTYIILLARTSCPVLFFSKERKKEGAINKVLVFLITLLMLMLISCGKASPEKENQYKVVPVEDEIEDPVTVTPSPTEKAGKPSANGSTAKPSADGSTAKPSADGSTAKQSTGGSTAKPSAGDASAAAPSASDAPAEQPSGDESAAAATSDEDAATDTPDQGADEAAAPSQQDYTGPLEGEPDTDF